MPSIARAIDISLWGYFRKTVLARAMLLNCYAWGVGVATTSVASGTQLVLVLNYLLLVDTWVGCRPGNRKGGRGVEHNLSYTVIPMICSLHSWIVSWETSQRLKLTTSITTLGGVSFGVVILRSQQYIVTTGIGIALSFDHVHTCHNLPLLPCFFSSPQSAALQLELGNLIIQYPLPKF